MVAALLLLAVLAVGAWAVRSPRDPDPRRSVRFLFAFSALLLAQRFAGELAVLAGNGALRGAAALVRAALGLALWACIARLAWMGERTRFAWVRWTFAGLAAVAALARPGPGVLAVLALPAVASFGWRQRLSTRELLTTGLGGIAVLTAAVLVSRLAPASNDADLEGPLAALRSLSRWSIDVALAYAVLGVLKAFAAFVRDPSLGIRTIGRRLALSHALVSAVPLLIVASLWVLTTWLGVGSDRALQGARALKRDGEALHGALAQALASGGDRGEALAALGRARRADWPHLRVWRVRGGALERAWGEPAGGEPALPLWLTAPDSLPRAGAVALAHACWLGAAVRDSAGEGAIALVPIGEAVRSGAARITGATLWMADSLGRELARARGVARDSVVRDSLTSVRARRVARRLGLEDSLPARPAARPGLHVVAGGDTIDVGGDDDEPAVTGAMGLATVPGVIWTGTAWAARDFPLSAKVTLGATLAGLFSTVRENPMAALPIAALAGLLLLLLPVAIFNFGLVQALGRSVLQPVAALRAGTAALAQQQTDHRIPIRGEDELWQAAEAFNQMAAGLERARELEKERDRLEHELDLARRIQQRLLPTSAPDVPGLEIAGCSEPAREVGGDYFDHIPLGDGRVLLVIADVSGKGVPAALLMSAFRASLMSQDAAHAGPAEVAERLNAFLHRSVEPGKFVTAFVGFLDGATGRFVYANAGHNPPVLLRANGEAEWLATGGLILGILPDSRFESGEAVLAPGDLLALYTDGVTEGADATGDMFGEERLVTSLRGRAGESCAGLAHGIVREVRAFEGAQGPADDITLLVARRPANPA